MAWNRPFDPEEEYVVVPVIPDDGTAIHNESGFCYDTTCQCHENTDSTKELNKAIIVGEITTQDADRISRGKTV